MDNEYARAVAAYNERAKAEELWNILDIKASHSPYARELRNKSPEEHAAILEEVQRLHDIRSDVLSKAAIVGPDCKFAPEISARATALINEMEALVPESTSTSNNRSKWSKVRALQMGTDKTKWKKWFRSHSSVLRTCIAMFPGIGLDSVVENITRNLWNGGMMLHVENQEGEKEKFRAAAKITDEEFQEAWTWCTAMAKKLREFLEICEVYRFTDIKLKPGNIDSRTDTDLVEVFISTCSYADKQWILLAFACYFEHEMKVNPSYLLGCAYKPIKISTPLPGTIAVSVPCKKYWDFDNYLELKEYYDDELACFANLKRTGKVKRQGGRI